ncbi:Enamine deaminase RidA, house cleaning of reactive enamine intermediates, YjgF/YER057c/UK114 family [Halobacillus karajensis]|uniref:Endoribonuclease L-PSP n=1 Tax=Halobacillus karajensis TaxID=195088 RepID=A0A024P818_9BACI|nr:RidA family protein [Halobacillus karajensis]CDQ18151.1 putative endoribonuclease L-PSP [Halobacillus karajensis]CDQ24502.1 putative endoribonuclease L-PSP [Halobacillus karajensis]CDQ29250.1 putative endoribonuclease L-PSP [Halobacillus karajensis]SEH58298.1 Enamine deaminase RidA, house cleaning of reactive enamine intermediates, YjgF/YER057c/UK114 family [Halobacillus karajensis]
MINVEEKIKELGIVIPEAPKPGAVYVPAKTVGKLVYTSGQDCRVNGKLLYEGKLGSDLTVKQGYEAAQQTMINCLAVLKAEIGNLSRIKQVIKLLAFVNSAPGFVEQPYVINGASELLEDILGDKGKHARSAIASNELPFNTPVEIEMIVEIE